MRDYRTNETETSTSSAEIRTIEIPACPSKQTRRKRRPRPAADHFHDLYEATGELLGQGSQGAVQSYRSIKTGQEFAVKIIEKTVDYNRRKILKEIDIFHHCKGHKNILQLNEFYEEDEKFYLVFDRLQGGTLFEQIQSRGHFTELEASEIIGNLADALAFLHKKGIAHRDLKPENILCEREDHVTPVRICDFDLGNAIVLQQESPVTTPELLTPVGSLEYMAPEVVDAWVGDSFSYNKKCDVWSLGIILYTMLCGYPPFYARCGRNCGWEIGESCSTCQNLLFEKIQEGTFEFPDKEWAHISPNAKNLIERMLVRDPTERYTAEQILQHPWITNPVPATVLATPRILSRNNSSQILDQFAENAFAFNRQLHHEMTISESRTSSSSASSNPFFSSSSISSCGSRSNESFKFMIGEFSDDDDEDEDVHKEFCRYTETTNKLGERSSSLKLSMPSSKLAQRRQSRQI